MKLNTLSFLAFCCSVAPLFAQGPLDGYMKGKGNVDIAASFSSMRANTFEGANGSTYEEPFRGNLLSVFAAVGVTDRFDLVATIPYILTSDQNGFQDGGIYAKYRPILIESPKVGRIGLTFGTGVSGPLSKYEVTVAGALGQRAVVVPARLIAQWDTPWGPFINVTGGYNWRIDNLRTEDIESIRIQRPDFEPSEPVNYTTMLFKAGLPAAKYYIDAWYEWQYTNPNEGTDYTPLVRDLPQSYGVSYHQIGGTIYYSENGKRGVFLSGAHILNGRNTSRINRITVGVVLKIS